MQKSGQKSWSSLFSSSEKGCTGTMEFFKVKTVEETFALIDEKISKIEAIENRSIEEALNYILAEDVLLKKMYPPLIDPLLMVML